MIKVKVKAKAKDEVKVKLKAMVMIFDTQIWFLEKKIVDQTSRGFRISYSPKVKVLRSFLRSR